MEVDVSGPLMGLGISSQPQIERVSQGRSGGDISEAAQIGPFFISLDLGGPRPTGAASWNWRPRG